MDAPKARALDPAFGGVEFHFAGELTAADQATVRTALGLGDDGRIGVLAAMDCRVGGTDDNCRTLARQKRGVNPADLTVHIAYPTPDFETGNHLERQAFALIDPFDAVAVAWAFAHEDLVGLEADEIRGGSRVQRRGPRELAGKSKRQDQGGHPETWRTREQPNHGPSL